MQTCTCTWSLGIGHLLVIGAWGLGLLRLPRYRFLLRRLDREDAVEAGDLEQLHELRTNAAEDEVVAAGAGAGELLVERQDDPDRLAGQVLHLAEVQDEPAALV